MNTEFGTFGLMSNIPTTQSLCPTCGRCPTCGHVAVPYHGVYWPQYGVGVPWWPTVPTETTTVG